MRRPGAGERFSRHSSDAAKTNGAELLGWRPLTGGRAYNLHVRGAREDEIVCSIATRDHEVNRTQRRPPKPPRRRSARRLLQADGRARTDDLLITNQLLYQLSYTGLFVFH